MSFRNAAVIVVARVFRLVSSTGVTLMEIGARLATSGSGIIGSSFTFFHRVASITNSSIVWTQNAPSTTDFDIVGPGNVNGGPGYLQMTADNFGSFDQAVKLGVNEVNAAGVGTDAQLSLLNNSTDHPQFLLYAYYGSVTPPFKSVGIRGELTSITTVLEIGSPVVPRGALQLNGTLVGYHYAHFPVLTNSPVGVVAIPVLPGVTVASLGLTAARDRMAASISYVLSCNVTAAIAGVDVFCAIIASGGPFGAGTELPASRTVKGLGSADDFSISATCGFDVAVAAGTVITITVTAWKTAAAGAVQSAGGPYTGLSITPYL